MAIPLQIEWIATLIGSVGSVVTSIAVLAYWLGKKFAEIDSRFKEIEMRFQQIDERFKHIDERFKQIDERFKEIDRRFEELKSYVDERFNWLKSYVDSRINRVAEAFRSYQEFFVEYLTAQGILRPVEASMIKGEALRVMKMAVMNPLTKEEWKRLKELLEKDELTLEEALELRELARKVTDEYGDRPEAWKLHIYASIMVGLAYRKMMEQEKKEVEKKQKQC